MAFLSFNPFQDIINGTAPATIYYQDDLVIAFKDISPKANTHILICPVHPFVTAKEVTEENKHIFGHLFLVAKKVAEDQGLTGYKLHMNVDEEGGQIVPHVHLHLLSPDAPLKL